MPGPIMFPCGQPGYPDCPPEPAAVINGVALYTAEQIATHGQAAYEKGKAEAMPPGAIQAEPVEPAEPSAAEPVAKEQAAAEATE